MPTFRSLLPEAAVVDVSPELLLSLLSLPHAAASNVSGTSSATTRIQRWWRKASPPLLPPDDVWGRPSGEPGTTVWSGLRKEQGPFDPTFPSDHVRMTPSS